MGSKWGSKSGVWDPPDPGGPGPREEAREISRGPGAGFPAGRTPPENREKSGVRTPRVRDPLARGSQTPLDPGSEMGPFFGPSLVLFIPKMGVFDPPSTWGGGGRILGGSMDPPSIEDPWDGPEIGRPGGPKNAHF